MRRKRKKSRLFSSAFGLIFAILTMLLLAGFYAGGVRELYAKICVQLHGAPDTVAESAVVFPSRQPETIVESAAVEKTEPPEPPPVLQTGKLSVAADYAPQITNHTDYVVDAAALFDEDIVRLEMADAPEILIVHTHSSESFAPDEEDPYLPDDVMRTLDTKYNVVRLGDAITAALEAAGIGVLHDREINDYPSYNGSYNQMRKRIEAYMQAYPTIKMVIDVHRDAILDAQGNNLAMTANVGGEDCARLMFVVGTDAGGLTHDHWRQNLSFAATLQGWGETLYPGLMRPIDLRAERFNQHTTPASLILEVGSAGNTLQEALRGAACFTEILLHTLGLDAE